MNKLTEKIAKRMAGLIDQQVEWIESQDNVVTDAILSSDPVHGDGYDLRQKIQALETGKKTLSHLKSHFEHFVGMSYDKYCEDNPSATKVETPEDRLLGAIKEMLKGGQL